MRPFCASGTRLVLGLGLAVGGCGEKKEHEKAPPVPAPSPVKRASADAAPAPVPTPPRLLVTPFDRKGRSEADALAEIGARSAWQSVLDRDRLLERRGDRGAVFGRLRSSGEPSGENWMLMDEREGEGGLGIRVGGLEDLQGSPPERAVVWGSYRSEEGGPWLFHIDRIEELSKAAEPPSERVPFELGPEAPEAEPPSVNLASQARPAGDFILFAVADRGDRIEEGWLIADEPGGKAVARLYLPGERSPYGGQDLVSEEERWKLFRGRRYWVKVGRHRKASPGQLPVYRAKALPAPASEELLKRLPAAPVPAATPKPPESGPKAAE